MPHLMNISIYRHLSMYNKIHFSWKSKLTLSAVKGDLNDNFKSWQCDLLWKFFLSSVDLRVRNVLQYDHTINSNLFIHIENLMINTIILLLILIRLMILILNPLYLFLVMNHRLFKKIVIIYIKLLLKIKNFVKILIVLYLIQKHVMKLIIVI